MVNLSILKDRRLPFYLDEHRKFIREHPLNNLPEKLSFMLTVDVEEGYIWDNVLVDGFDHINPALEETLDFMHDFGKCTFFVDGIVTEKAELPSLQPHEIGCHGYDHSAVGNDWWIKEKDRKFRSLYSICQGTTLVDLYFNVKVSSFRAPKFSISPEAFRLLDDLGYRIDSSLNPHNSELFPSKKGSILEIPISRNPIPTFKFPFFKFYTLSMHNLERDGVDVFYKQTLEILRHHRKNAFLVFVAHSWNIQRNLGLLREYFGRVEKDFKVDFIRMEDLKK